MRISHVSEGLGCRRWNTSRYTHDTFTIHTYLTPPHVQVQDMYPRIARYTIHSGYIRQRPVGYVYPEGGYMYLNAYPVHLVVLSHPSTGYVYPDVYPDVSQR